MPVIAFAGAVVPALVIATTAISGEPYELPVATVVAPNALSGTPADAVSAPDPGHAADTELCVAISGAVEDAGLAVEARDRLPKSTLIARLRSAEAEIGRRRHAVDPRLGAASEAMQEAVVGLRHAVETGAAVAAAIGVVLDWIDELDAACQARLRPGATN